MSAEEAGSIRAAGLHVAWRTRALDLDMALMRIRDNAFDFNDECRWCGNSTEDDHADECPAAIARAALEGTK